MDIVQFSDFHFGNKEPTFDWRMFAEYLSDVLRNKVDNPVVIISGDVTFKGCKEGYVQAKNFFDFLISKGVLERSRIIICPGNHDIVESSFKEFDSFAYSIRKDSKCSFDDTHCREIIIDDVMFKVFNTSFHLDHQYGLIDSSCFKQARCEYDGLKIAVMHHHVINMFEKDTSAIRNAYELIKYLDLNGFKYVLHGHQHASQNYYIVVLPMQVISARSCNYSEKGYFNSVNIYRICDGVLTGEALLAEKTSSKINFYSVELK